MRYSLNEDRGTTRIVSSLPLGTLSWIIWIVFMILYYGTGTISTWPVFWIWFPFWFPFAFIGALLVFALICAFILAALDN